jgi:hypothetical protein
MEAGKASATHDPSLIALGRGRQGQEDLTEVPVESRRITRPRRPVAPDAVRHVWGEAVRRTSLAVEAVLQPGRRWRD